MKLTKSELNNKLTIAIDDEIAEIYRMGKKNGWNMPDFVRRAIRTCMKENLETLENPAWKSKVDKDDEGEVLDDWYCAQEALT